MADFNMQLESQNIEGQADNSEPNIESNENEGQAEISESQNAEGQSNEPEDNVTLESLQRDYKALQAEFTKRNEAEKQLLTELQKYGGKDAILQIADFINQNPDRVSRFEEFIKQESQPLNKRNELGIDEASLTDEEKEALEMMNKLAEQKVKNEIQQLEQKIQPFVQAQVNQHINSLISKLDNEYGQDWRKYEKKMSEIAQTFPFSDPQKLTMDDMYSLLDRAVRLSGDKEDFEAKMYEKKLKSAKEKQMSPSQKPSGKTNFKQASNIWEAWNQAKQQLGGSPI